MRKALFGLASAAALASMVAANGCGGSNSGSGGTTGSGGSTGNGGASASGGSGGTTSSTKCPNGSSCGGDLVGTWNVTSSCLELAGDMAGLELYMGCPKIPVTGELTVTGKWTANANGTYTDETVTTGSMTFPLSSECLVVSSTPVECSNISSVFTAAGWETATCKTESGKCNCSVTANQKGGIGVVFRNAEGKGDYTTEAGVLNTDGEREYSYCVSGDTLTLTPKSTVLPLAGTIVLKKDFTSGTGGAAGGAAGSGGKVGAGGATTGSGGAGPAGGRTGAGGTTTGSGGAGPAGGRTGAGGTTTGSGGAGPAGGRTGAGGTTTGSGGATTGAGGAATGGTTSVGGATGTRPCDIYGAASAKCVAAHSTVRALFAGYTGKLYQVKRASDKTTQDILVGADGFADSAAQETFCTGTTCVITFVYDQSGNGNDVEAETADSKVGGNSGQTAANASQESLKVGGHKVYSLYLKQAQAYWKDGSKSNMPLGKSPQGVYMVSSGTRTNISGCCFDYGNGPLSRKVSGCGTMDAVNFSTNTQWEKGTGSGPWVMADFECGLKSGSSSSPSMTQAYVTAIEKNNGTSEYQLRGADATTGKVSTFYKGKLPFTQAKEGAIILGSGGDCCYSNTTMSQGTFYEGAIVAGYPDDATDDAVQANIVAAQYGK